MTPQCVDKMLSNNTFLGTKIQQLLDGLILVEKDDMHMQTAEHARKEKVFIQ